jgi:Glycosyl transferases group 1
MTPAHPMEWHLLTPEYPPVVGGVSDYSRLVATGLAAAGHTVHVWCPPTGSEEAPPAAGVHMHRELGKFTPRDLRRVGHMLDRFPAPRRLLLQWVPHGYGYRSMNLLFCLWIWRRAATSGDLIDIMVHEPCLAFRIASWKQNAAAAVHRIMTVILVNATQRVWLSIPAWEAYWRPYAFGRRVPFTWLPVPSSIAVAERGVSSALRGRYATDGRLLVGHFGTYGDAIADMLMSTVPLLAGDRSGPAVLLLGRGSEEMRDRFISRWPNLATRIHATGQLDAWELSRHLAACDVLLQPYPDGVCSRHTSIMAGLAHGLPIVTTAGRLTEPLWRDTACVALVDERDAAGMVARVRQLLVDADERRRLGATARAIYDERFHVRNTIAALRAAA